MTIKDLIEKLQTFDENLSVFVDGYEYGIQNLELENIRERNIKLNVNDSPRFGGPHEEDPRGESSGVIISRNSSLVRSKYITATIE